MAYVAALAGHITGSRFETLMAAWREHALKRQKYNQTVRELRGLSDRELSDLGIHRSAIRGIAREAAGLN